MEHRIIILFYIRNSKMTKDNLVPILYTHHCKRTTNRAKHLAICRRCPVASNCGKG